MIYETETGARIRILGDTHLGRKFERGVPLHRRGEREVMQWSDFEKSLNDVDGCAIHVMLGDLFDKWAVPYEVIARAAKLYKQAKAKNPSVVYVVLRGNHDASRDLERVSAFALFSELVHPHVVVVDDCVLTFPAGGAAFLPWHPVLSAGEIVDQWSKIIQGSEVAFGHWDVVAPEDKFNLLPAAKLKALGVKEAITGHDHLKRELIMDGLAVTVPGSMQPYSHAEDPEEKLYVTRSLADVMADPGAFKDKCLRVKLAAGETLTAPIDCLQLTVVVEGSEEEDDTAVEMGAFDFEKLFVEAFKEEGVEQAFLEKAKIKWESERLKG